MVVLTKTGERRIWEYTHTLRTHGVSTPIVRGVAHDIRSRDACRKHSAIRKKFSKAFHLSPVAKAIVTLADGKLLDVNAAFEKQFGIAAKKPLPDAVEIGMWMIRTSGEGC